MGPFDWLSDSEKMSRLRTENVALRQLVRMAVQAEDVDLEHCQFIYRSGPQDWDAVPMTGDQHALLTTVLTGKDVADA